MFNRIKTGIAAVAAVTVAGTSASAGGLSDQIVEAPVEQDAMVAPASRSAPDWLIPVLILGALVGLAASSDDSSSDSDEDRKSVV